MGISLDTVREAARLLDEKNLAEISVEATREGGPTEAFTLRRAATAAYATSAPARHAEGGHGGGDSQASLTTNTEGEPAAPAVEPLLVRAAAVGLFRNPPRPVRTGDEVTSGQVVGIVESLKVPNEVRAPQAGRIVEVLVEEGQGVEYGQPIAALRVGG